MNHEARALHGHIGALLEYAITTTRREYQTCFQEMARTDNAVVDSISQPVWHPHRGDHFASMGGRFSIPRTA